MNIITPFGQLFNDALNKKIAIISASPLGYDFDAVQSITNHSPICSTERNRT